MADASERLLQLRPVKVRYKKADVSGEKPIQYGLIAEEVAKVYPELVVRDQTTGRIDGVRYDELAPMLLNETQQQAAEIRDLKQQVAQMHAALLKLQAKDEQVAQR
jgi:dethiobiotin synthetase